MVIATNHSGGDENDYDGSVGLDTVSNEFLIKYKFLASVSFLF